jgi:DNA-binding XRE family transcriptional regulator
MKKTGAAKEAGAAFHGMREAMGWTQAETAYFLGISKKAVESYEQGWRHPPLNVCKQMLTVLALERGYPKDFNPCWEIMRCSPAVREACFCARRMHGNFCWLTCTANLHQKLGGKKMKEGCCFHCPVVKQFI